jgi:hypothetical protein
MTCHASMLLTPRISRVSINSSPIASSPRRPARRIARATQRRACGAE